VYILQTKIIIIEHIFTLWFAGVAMADSAQ